MVINYHINFSLIIGICSMFDNIILFTKVIENNGFNKTAELENISNSTLSRKIKELEDYFNKPLLVRNTRSFTVTAEGKELYEKFKDAAPRLDNFLANNKPQAKQQTLNIILPVMVSLEIFTPYLHIFNKANPDIELNILFMHDQLDLQKHGIDIAVTTHSTDDYKSYDQRIIYKEIVQLYCTPEYANKYGIPRSIDELTSHNFIGGLEVNGNHIPFIFRNFNDSKQIQIDLDMNVRISNLIHAFKIGINNDYIFPCWNYFCDHRVENGTLIKVFPEYFVHSCDLYLITRRNISNHAQRFIDFIYQCINKTINTNITDETIKPNVNDLL